MRVWITTDQTESSAFPSKCKATTLCNGNHSLKQVRPPDASVPGMLLAAASIIIMSLLGKKKYELGNRIGSGALVADSKETFVCVKNEHEKDKTGVCEE